MGHDHMHFLQIVCERSEVFASACALVRAFPQYSRKTSSIAPDSFSPKTKEKSSHVVNVEFICTDGRSVTEEDVPCLNHAARGIQMAARIVDTPCNEMHTDAFLDVRHFYSASPLNSLLSRIIAPTRFLTATFLSYSSSGRLARTCPSNQ